MKVAGLGSLYRQRSSKYWWVKYYVAGKPVRKSTGCISKKDAVNFLRQRQGLISEGRHPSAKAERTSFEDLMTILLNNYVSKKRKSLRYVKHEDGSERPHLDQIPPLRAFFGRYLAKDITYDLLEAYVADRVSQGRALATARNELAMLRRAFKLAQRGNKARCPEFPEIDARNPRQGFFEREDFEHVLAHLPEDLRPVMEFGYLTGWRMGEIVGLTWRKVDFRASEIRLEPMTTKNNDGRTIPFDALPSLKRLIETQRAKTDRLERDLGCIIPWVFHRGGREVKDFRGAWDKACTAAGLPGRLRHDLRRTAVRNLERAGVPRSVAMKITGHKSEHVYREYAIADVNSLREGLAKLARLHEAEGVQGAEGA